MAVTPIPPYTSPLPAPASGTQSVREAESVAKARSVAGEAAASNNTLDTAKQLAAQPSREQVDKAMTEVKKALAPVARNLQFSVDEETGRTVIKVIDVTTNEVIRQMPSEELLAITKAMDSFSGLFVKQKA